MKKSLVGAIVGLLLLAFYWFEFRPSEIRSSCAASSREEAGRLARSRAAAGEYTGLSKKQLDEGWFYAGDQERAYQDCLRASGLRGPKDNL